MAFQTGTATDIDALINTELKTFLQAQGWTVNDDSWPNHLAVNKGTCYISLRRRGSGFGDETGSNTFNDAFSNSVNDTRFRMIISSGYNGTPGTADERWYSQPDNTGTTTSTLLKEVECNDLGGSISYYAFFTGDPSTSNYVHVVFETLSGYFGHFGFGEVDTQGSSLVTNPAYAFASYWGWWPNSTSYSSRADVRINPSTSHRILTSTESTNMIMYQGSAGDTEVIKSRTEVLRSLSLNRSSSTDRLTIETGLLTGGANGLNGVSPMYPILLGIDLATNSNAFYSLGVMPDTRLVNLQNLTPKQEISFGNDTWLVVPLRRRRADYGLVPEAEITNVAPFENTSGFAGLAFKKVV